ncbi:MAG: ester cyclase [Pseudomonadota bacterium]
MSRHKELSAQSLAFWGPGDLGRVTEVFTDNYTNHQEPDVDGGPKSIDLKEWTDTVASFREAFPATKVEIFQQIGEGDYVSTRWRFEGVLKGEYLGLPPTGKTYAWSGIQIDRFEDGKIAESWVNWDMYSLFKDLGIIK